MKKGEKEILNSLAAIFPGEKTILDTLTAIFPIPEALQGKFSIGPAPVYETSPIKRRRSTKAGMNSLRSALYQIVKQQRPMTVRQVFPREVSVAPGAETSDR